LIVTVVGVLNAVAANDNRLWGASVSLINEYTDNRDGTDTNKESNLDVSVKPRVDLKYKDERTSVDFYYAPSLLWRSNPRETSEGDPQNETEIYHALGLDLSQQFSRINLGLKDYFATTDDPEISEGGSAVRANMSHLYNNTEGNLGVLFGERASLIFTAGGSIKRYDDADIAADQNEDTFQQDNTGKLLLGSGYYATLHAGYSQFANKSSITERGSRIYTVDLGAEKRFNPILLAKASAGYQALDYKNDRLDADETPYGSASLVLSQGGTSLDLSGSYGFYGPYVRPYSAQKRALVAATLERQMTPKIVLGVKTQYGRGEYTAEDISETTTLPSGFDALWLNKFMALFNFTDYLSLELDYQYEMWDSDLREEFDRNTVTATLKASI
jgi:hypothetical protein